MILKEIIERVDEYKPNSFSQKVKLGWIAELEGKLATDVFLLSAVDTASLEYRYPDDLESEPLVKFPHSCIYEYWLGARVDYENGEYSKYQNSMEMFNAAYGNFVRWYAATYGPANGRRGAGCSYGKEPPYYVTAYALAVKRGFAGSEDEWLESLAGSNVELRLLDGTVQWRQVRDVGEAGEWAELFKLTDISRGATFVPQVIDGVLSWTNDQGIKNPDPVEIAGKDGKDGHTPEKEVDYFTEEDQALLVQKVLGELPEDGGGTVTSVNGVQPDENGNVQLELGGEGAVTSVNGVTPDKEGNVQIETGVTPEEVLEALPAVTAVDFSAFDQGSFMETVDGEAVTHSVTFDDQGRPTSIGGIAITWGDA